MNIFWFIISAIGIIAVTLFFLRVDTWKPFMLNTAIKSKVNETPNSIKIGMEGKTISRLAPIGKARFNNEIIEVSSRQNFIDENQDVIITDIENNKIIVKIK